MGQALPVAARQAPHSRHCRSPHRKFQHLPALAPERIRQRTPDHAVAVARSGIGELSAVGGVELRPQNRLGSEDLLLFSPGPLPGHPAAPGSRSSEERRRRHRTPGASLQRATSASGACRLAASDFVDAEVSPNLMARPLSRTRRTLRRSESRAAGFSSRREAAVSSSTDDTARVARLGHDRSCRVWPATAPIVEMGHARESATP
jgi:hypothetical protein